ncbi:hypothetical protein [Calothrix sp. 336/3]|uniref:hypothetical protein n=1 Tax=Calothrix sp. 336/3 TaxID=1337936 RepID=UPI00143B1746|nr:hypothetical protein [Calothrix sp. 336/3]
MTKITITQYLYQYVIVIDKQSRNGKNHSDRHREFTAQLQRAIDTIVNIGENIIH